MRIVTGLANADVIDTRVVMYVNVIVLTHPRNTTNILTPLHNYQWYDQSFKIIGFSFAYMVDFKYLTDDEELYKLYETHLFVPANL